MNSFHLLPVISSQSHKDYVLTRAYLIVQLLGHFIRAGNFYEFKFFNIFSVLLTMQSLSLQRTVALMQKFVTCLLSVFVLLKQALLPATKTQLIEHVTLLRLIEWNDTKVLEPSFDPSFRRS